MSAQQPSQEEFNQFKAKVSTFFSGKLELSDTHYRLIFESYTQAQYTRLTTPFLLQEISHVTGRDYADVFTPSRKNPPRACKKIPEPVTPQPRKTNYQRRGPLREQDKESNGLILNNANTTPRTNRKLQKISQETGARLTQLRATGTDDDGNCLQSTPKNKTTVRRLYQGEFGDLYKPQTPKASKNNPQGRVHPKPFSPDSNTRRFCREKPQSIEFTVNLPELLKKKYRHRTQKALLRASSRELFAAHKIETFIKAKKGSYYHIYHIIGIQFGGIHGPKNMVPTTASANYSCLYLIEYWIRELLLTEKTDTITINADLTYNEGSYVPNYIHYTLSWQQNGKTLVEKISISACSYDGYNRAERQTVRLMREASQHLLFSPEKAPREKNNDKTPLASLTG